MPVRREAVGGAEHVRSYEVSAAAIEAYADAVGDPGPAYREGETSVAPPLFAIVCGWDAMESCVRDALSNDLLLRILHLTQDMRFGRPIRGGDHLTSRARLSGVEGGKRSTTLVVRVDTVAEEGEEVASFHAGIYVAGHGGEESSGEALPEFKTPRDGEPLGTLGQSVAADQTILYAEASGDHNPIHLDDAVAQSVGHPGVILHGMCTLAFAARAAVELLCGGDVARLARIAARFSKPVFPGHTLATTFWASGTAGAFAFETTGPDGAAIRHGRVELR